MRPQRGKPVSGVVNLQPKGRQRIDWDEAARLYVDEGWSFARVASKFHYTAKRVRLGLAERGVRARPREKYADNVSFRLHTQWVHMRRRCEHETETGYETAGALGIRVAEEWLEFEAFRRWALECGYKPGMTIVRVDPLSDYSAENCELVTGDEARGAARLLAFGESKSISAWSRDPRCVVTRTALAMRLKRGMSPEDAISHPLDEKTERVRKSRSAGPHSSQVDWARARSLYELGTMSTSEVAQSVGCEVSTLLEGLHRFGVVRGKPAGTSSLFVRRLRTLWSKLGRESRVDVNHRTAMGAPMTSEPAWSRFEEFLGWACENGWRPGLCLARVDKTAPYGPSNCRWLTRREVTLSKRPPSHPMRSRVLVTAFGETKGLTAWSRDKRCAVSLTALTRRLRGGLHPESAISDPPQNAAATGRYRHFLEAFGERKSVSQWLEDSRCRVTATGLALRLARGMNAETAISTPPFKA